MTKTKEKSLYSVWFVVPSLAIFILFFLWPVISSLYYSMTVWNFETATFNGLENYKLFFTDPAMSTSVPHTLLYAFMTSGLKVVLAFFIAIFLTSSIKTKGFIRSAVFFPNLVSTMAVGLAFAYMMHPTKGLLNVVIQAFGGQPVDFLGEPGLALWSIIMTDVWKGLSISVVIYIAGIQSIDRSYYEAASIDGANWWQQIINVTLPLVAPAQNSIILSLIGGLRTFDLIWAMTGGGPGFATDVLASVIYKQYAAGFYGDEEESEAAEDDGELGMDLMAAFDEADMPEIVEEAEEVDRTEIMENLINEAMDARQDEGINAALDNTFAALARNAMELANPETGVIEVSGNEIVAMTVNAAQDRFGATREKTLGAVAAAASRADEMGYIQALGGDARLVSLAISDIEKEAAKQSRKIVKAAYDSALESIAVANPMFKPYVPLLKALTAYMFEDHFASDPNAEIKAELAKIQAQITETKQNLMSAMNGATLCFTSPNNEIFGGYNIFDATYRRACEEVMFSKEAIDISMPYLLSQLSCYTAACVIMEEVFNAYEEVWGAGTLEESREKMLIRLTGMNLEGQPAGKSVYNLFNDFCNRDKFIFVNKNNRTNIKINPNLRVVPYFGKRYTNEKMQWNKRDLPDFVQNCPLNADQMKALADYVNQKNTLLILFLGEIGFRGNFDIDVNESLNGLDYYMPTGAQNTVSVKDSSSSSGYYTKREIQINAIQIWRLGATDRKVTLRTIESSTSSYSDKPSTVHLMVFQPR